MDTEQAVKVVSVLDSSDETSDMTSHTLRDMATEIRLQIFKEYFETTQSGKPLLAALRGELSLYEDALIAYYANTKVLIKLNVDKFVGRPLPSVGVMGLLRNLRIVHAAIFMETPKVGNLHGLELLRAMPSVQSLDYQHHDRANSPIPALMAMVTAFTKLTKLKLVIPKSKETKAFLKQVLLHLDSPGIVWRETESTSVVTEAILWEAERGKNITWKP